MLTRFKKEWLLAVRNIAAYVNPIAFFLIVISLFPMVGSMGLHELHTIAPVVVWVAALLAVMINLPSLFQSDYDDGSLEQQLLSTQSMASWVVLRLLVHWLFVIAPMMALCPVAALFFGLHWHETLLLMLSLLLATPTIILVGAIVSALLVGSRNGGILLGVLVLPLVIPVLIFSVALVSSISVVPLIAILFGLMAFTVSLAPFAVVGALRIS